MTDQTPDPASSHPLVTFAVFAYNQEQYIREAVEGAFSQTYEPLEIILSDDYSPDRTFEIMEEMARAYEGPHEVRLRRNTMNLGTALHVGSVATEMQGRLLVVAAGDDISYPERTDILVSAWRDAGFPLGTVHSATKILGSETGDQQQTLGLCHDVDDSINLEWFLKNRRLPFKAPACAYTKELFTHFQPILGGSIIEDSVLACRSMLIGESIPVARPLVYHRQLPLSGGRGYTINDPKRWNLLVRSKIISRLNRLQDVMGEKTLSFETQKKYQRLMLKEIEKLSAALVPDRRVQNWTFKIIFFFRLVFHYPSSQRFLLRVSFALDAIGWSNQPFARFIVSLAKRLSRGTLAN